MATPLVSGGTDLITEYWTGKAKKKDQKTPTVLFKEYCDKYPWAVECKQYEI